MTDAILSIRPDIANAHAQSLAQSGARVSGTRSNGLSDGTLHFTDSWMDKNSAVRGRRNPSAIDPYLWLGSITPASPRLSVNVVRCPIWERSNRIYSQITQATPADASGALQLGSAHYADMIFKAVLNGWDALNGQEQRNPILRTLRDIDQVFPQLDPISRSAFMYKSHKLLRVSLQLGVYCYRELTVCSTTWIPRNATWRTCLSGKGHCKIYDSSLVNQCAN